MRACGAAQKRMVDGTMWVQKEGPFKSVDELWDGETNGRPESSVGEE